MKTTLILTGIVGLALCGCQPKTPSNSNLKADKMEAVKAIEATLKTYEDALNDSNTDAVVALYAQDGVFMPSGAPSAQGGVQIRAAYNHVFGNIKLDIAFSIDEIVPQGDFAFARTLSKGDVTVLAQDVTLPEENRELFILKKATSNNSSCAAKKPLAASRGRVNVFGCAFLEVARRQMVTGRSPDICSTR